PPAPPRVMPGDAAAWPAFFGTCRNDLQPAVVARHPVLGDGLRRLAAERAVLTLMSGSGSALFGLFAPDTDLRAAAADWPAAWRVWTTRTLSRADYRAGTNVRGPSGAAHPLFEGPTVV